MTRVSFEDSLNDLRKQFSSMTQHGQFDFYERSEKLAKVIEMAEVAKGYGVYVISGYRLGVASVIYIGKSGTIKTDGAMKLQGLAKRLTKKYDKTTDRDTYFRMVIRGKSKEMPSQLQDKLTFEWFETYQKGKGMPPFLVEAQLLAAYLGDHGRLPKLNRNA